jgi:hypothetical protein
MYNYTILFGNQSGMVYGISHSLQRCRKIDNPLLFIRLIFIYSCAASLISVEIHCFYGLWTRIYEYEPPLLSIFLRPWFIIS